MDLHVAPHPEPPSHLPPHLTPLDHPSAPALSTCLMHPTWIYGCRKISSRMTITIKHDIMKNTSLVLKEYLEYVIFIFFPVISILDTVVREKSITLPSAVRFNSLKLKDVYVMCECH